MKENIESLYLQLLRTEAMILTYAEVSLKPKDLRKFYESYPCFYLKALEKNKKLYPEMFQDKPGKEKKTGRDPRWLI